MFSAILENENHQGFGVLDLDFMLFYKFGLVLFAKTTISLV